MQVFVRVCVYILQVDTLLQYWVQSFNVVVLVFLSRFRQLLNCCAKPTVGDQNFIASNSQNCTYEQQSLLITVNLSIICSPYWECHLVQTTMTHYKRSFTRGNLAIVCAVWLSSSGADVIFLVSSAIVYSGIQAAKDTT